LVTNLPVAAAREITGNCMCAYRLLRSADADGVGGDKQQGLDLREGVIERLGTGEVAQAYGRPGMGGKRVRTSGDKHDLARIEPGRDRP